MTARSRILLLAFSALGVAASASSTFVHYRLLTDPTYASFCDISASVNCTQAYTSQYGSFLGVPVAPVGLLYFLFVLLMAGVAGRTTSPASEKSKKTMMTVTATQCAAIRTRLSVLEPRRIKAASSHPNAATAAIPATASIDAGPSPNLPGSLANGGARKRRTKALR